MVFRLVQLFRKCGVYYRLYLAQTALKRQEPFHATPFDRHKALTTPQKEKGTRVREIATLIRLEKTRFSSPLKKAVFAIYVGTFNILNGKCL